MAYSLWRRVLAAASNEKLPDPPPSVSPAIAHIVLLLEDQSRWTRDETQESTYTDLFIRGPHGITIAECSYVSSWHHVHVNGDELDLNKTDERELVKALRKWSFYASNIERQESLREKAEREDRINKHLGITA